MAPTRTDSSPLRSQGRPVILVLAAPTPNRAVRVRKIDSAKARSTARDHAYGKTGKAAPTAYASATTSPDRSGAVVGATDSPNSSVIMVSTQNFGSAVTCSTMVSSALP